MARLLEASFTAEKWRMMHTAVMALSTSSLYAGRHSDLDGVTPEIDRILGAEEKRLGETCSHLVHQRASGLVITAPCPRCGAHD